MKLFFLPIVSLLLCIGFISKAQEYKDLDKKFPSDSIYTKDLLPRLENAVRKSTFKPECVSQLQEKFSTIQYDSALNLKLTDNNKVNSISELYETRKKAIWVVSKLFNSRMDTLKEAVPIATAYSIDASGICVTNYHVLASIFSPLRSRMTRTITPDSSLFFLQNVDGDIYFMDALLGFDPISDIAVFHIHTDRKDLPYIPLAKEINIGDPVYIVSHPDNNFYYLSSGIVNRKHREFYNYKISGPFPKYIMDISADYAIGSSGGPVLNKNGELVGMVSSTNVIRNNPGTPNQQQMVLKKAVPIEAIRKLLLK